MTIEQWLTAKRQLIKPEVLSDGSKILLKWWELSKGSPLREAMEAEANKILDSKEQK